MELFKVPLLNENKRLATSFCDEMIKEWMNEGGRTAKQNYWKEVKTLIELSLVSGSFTYEDLQMELKHFKNSTTTPTS